MTNDLHDETIKEEAISEAPAAEEPKTVFSPSRWERHREERAAKNAAPSSSQEDAARREEREAQRQRTTAEMEAKKLELKIAQENRKAQEEQDRRERKAQEEERRRERKAQEEERRERERERRREEKAELSSVRRVGTLTLGLSLIAIGAAILAYMIHPSFDIRIVAYLAPVILIGLGAEILLRQLLGKGKPFRYDFASGFICILLVLGSFAVALVPYVLYYISPERFSFREEQLNAVRDQVYAAFQGDQRVRNYNVYGNVNEVLTAAHVDENGRWTYELDYLSVEVDLMDGCSDEAAFAQVCRQLLDRLQAQNISSQGGDGRGDRFVIRIGAPENDQGVSYNLWINNRLKMEMDAGNLAKLVDTSYSVPTRANGWTNDGYEEILDNFGQPYADHFAELLEQFGPNEAQQYYTILVDTYLIDIAEMYYNGCVNGPVMPVPDQVVQAPDEASVVVPEGEETGNSSIAVPDGTAHPGVGIDGIDQVEYLPEEGPAAE